TPSELRQIADVSLDNPVVSDYGSCSSTDNKCNAQGLSTNTQAGITDAFGSSSDGWTFGAQMELWF
ncbi:MAG: hypothetical protein ACPGEF_05170, partial [Endozoicomonas sp.]